MGMILLFLTLLGISSPAFAYIDPVSGSAIFSAIIGAIVAVGLFFKTYWFKVKSLFTGKKSEASGGDQG